MIRLTSLLALCATLAGCGLDGPPQRPGPSDDRPEPGISVTGDGYVGVSTGI